MSHANEDQSKELKRLKSEKDTIRKIKVTKSIFDELGVESMCHQIMQDYYQKALNHFNAIQLENKTSALLDLTEALMKRDF